MWKIIIGIEPPKLIRNQLLLLTSMRCWSSVIDERVKFFNEQSATWWDVNGSMKQMHLSHPHQIAFVSHQLLGHEDGVRAEATLHHHQQQPLARFKIADVGCGVGMNSEKLALLGAEVSGIDPSERAIEMAKAHAQTNPELGSRLKYFVSTAEEHRLTHSGHYDAVLVFFILKHIRNRQEFIDNCLALLKPRGSLFIGHVNPSLAMYFYIWWHARVTRLIQGKLVLSQRRFLTHKEVTAMVNRGYPCELKGEQSLYWPLDGQSFRVTNSNQHVKFLHYVKKI